MFVRIGLITLGGLLVACDGGVEDPDHRPGFRRGARGDGITGVGKAHGLAPSIICSNN